jgi:alkyl hydroperoxide reductase subunit AhpC
MSIVIPGMPAPTREAVTYVRGSAEPLIVPAAGAPGRWTALAFYPRDFSSVCTSDLVAFADLAGEFAAEGADVMAASTDTFWTHRAWFCSHALLDVVGYPVLADDTLALAGAYGILTDDGTARRATYLIDPDGIVRHLAITDGTVGRSADETLRILQALRSGERCPADWRPGRPTLRAA